MLLFFLTQYVVDAVEKKWVFNWEKNTLIKKEKFRPMEAIFTCLPTTSSSFLPGLKGTLIMLKTSVVIN